MADKRPIGYTVTQYWCRDCVPEGLKDCGHPPLVEGDDAGIPYTCDVCGEELLPCDHQWAEKWNKAYTPDGEPPREIDFCNECGDVRYRPMEVERV